MHGRLGLDVAELVDPVVHERERRDALAWTSSRRSTRPSRKSPPSQVSSAAVVALRVGALEVGGGHRHGHPAPARRAPGSPASCCSWPAWASPGSKGRAGVEAAVGGRGQHGQVGDGGEAHGGEARLPSRFERRRRSASPPSSSARRSPAGAPARKQRPGWACTSIQGPWAGAIAGRPYEPAAVGRR